MAFRKQKHRSTGSQKEPSRSENNTNQSLTEHSHSPHRHGTHTPSPGPLLSLLHRVVTFTALDEWMLSFELPPRRSWQKLEEEMSVCVLSACKRVTSTVLPVSFSRYSMVSLSGEGAKRIQRQWDWSGTAMPGSALRSANRVQNTYTNCPLNIGLVREGEEREKQRIRARQLWSR